MHDGALTSEDVRGPDVLLLIEVGDSSRDRDLVLKAALYSRHGVRDYWVLDAERRRIVLHTQPSAEGYGRAEVREVGARLALPFRPQVELRSEELDWP